MYILSASIQNALTSLHGNQTSEFFNSNPPTLDEYVDKYIYIFKYFQLSNY